MHAEAFSVVVGRWDGRCQFLVSVVGTEQSVEGVKILE